MTRLRNLTPRVVVDLSRILKPFKSQFMNITAWAVIYEIMNLLHSSIVGMLAFIIDKNLGMAWLLLHTVVFTSYEEIFIRFDNYMDLKIIRLQHDIYKYLKVGSMRVFAYMDEEWVAANNTTDIYGEIERNTEKAWNAVGAITWELIPTFLQGLIASVIMLFVSPGVLLMSFIVLLVIARVTHKQEHQQRPERKNRRRVFREASKVSSWLKAHATIAAFGREEDVLERFKSLEDEAADRGQSLAERDVNIYGRPKMRATGFLARATTLLMGWQVMVGTLPFPILLSSLEIVSRLSNSISRGVRVYTNLVQDEVALSELADFLELKPTICSVESTVPMPAGKLGVEFKDVHLTYPGKETVALDNISFSVEPGEVVGLVGLSGAGKTTLVNLMSRVRDVHYGSIGLNGHDIREFDLAELRSAFGIVSQETQLLDASIDWNVRIARPDCTEDEIWWALRMAGLESDVRGYKNGLCTEIGERGVQLSGGQRQRLAIARALLRKPRILVFDEATSNQDANKAREIQRGLIRLVRDSGQTMFVIAHDLSTLLGLVGRILVMDRGRLVQVGTHEELLMQDGLYKKLWESHTMGVES